MELAQQKILIIRLSSIGDILLTTPLLRLLKTAYPDSQIDFVVKKRFIDLIRMNPYLSNIYTFDENLGFKDLVHIKNQIRSNHYHIIIDIHRNFRSWYLHFDLNHVKTLKYSKYRFKRFLLVKFGINLYTIIIPVYERYLNSAALLGIKDDNNGLELFIDGEVKNKIDIELKQTGFTNQKPVFGIAPGAGFLTKRWLPEGFSSVVKKLIQENNAQVILFGGEQDKILAKRIAETAHTNIFNFAGKLSLMESACVMSHCDIMLSNDTGLLHMATALKIPVVAIFGSTTKELGFFPTGTPNRVLQVDLNCRPCTHIGRNTCPKGHFRCMQDITPLQVYNTLIQLYQQTSNQYVKGGESRI